MVVQRNRGALSMTSQITLRDNRTVSVRPLDPTTDRQNVSAILNAMSDDARYHRFLRPMPRIRRDLIDALTAADGINHLAVIATDEGNPVGMARVAITATEAELAVEITDAYTGVGLGRHLTETVLAMAADRGLSAVGLYVASDNVAACRLFARLGARFRFENGVLVGSIATRLAPRAA
jgi:ribosomal protein S18 acetylase RimI-like enzyme